MHIEVNAEKSLGSLANFWNHIHFHPTDAVEDSWGRDILERIARDRVAGFVRLHTMLEDIVWRDSAGYLVFDFTGSDRRLDFMVEKGFRLLLCFDFMPPCLVDDQRNVSKLRYKDKTFNRCCPRNYVEWGEVCQRYVEHLVERYGADTVAEWRFHCWNEPDGGYWINSKNNDISDAEGDTEIKLSEYVNLYTAFEAACRAVSPATKVGGPSCAGSDLFIAGFLRHLREDGIRLDFVSVHCYSQGIYSNLPNRYFISPDNILQRLTTLRTEMNNFGYSDTEMILDEWGMAGGGFLGIDRDPRMILRETEYFPAFFARLVDQIANRPELNLSQMMICLSGQDHSVRDFDGYRTFFTASGYPKPIYNGYALLADLGDSLVHYDIVNPEPHLGVLPTLSSDGRVGVLLYHYVDDYQKQVGNRTVSLRINGIQGKRQLRHRRIDSVNANAFTAWSRLGCPTAPTMLERARINDAGQLTDYVPPVTIEANGTVTAEVVLPAQSVSLLEWLPLYTPLIQKPGK